MEETSFKRICVNCGSSPGLKPEYIEAARTLGRLLVRNHIDLVYGGADVGLMGEIADVVISGGGVAIGIIPKFFANKVSHKGLTELHIVDSMHERKQMMFDLSDGFIALPGGMGTLEEIFELITWTQLGLHKKPCGILNVCGYYDPLFRFLDHAVSQMFIRQEHRDTIMVESSPDILMGRLSKYHAPNVEKWVGLKKKDITNQ
jgi:uncharacterized protein (TIGR00730 family)